MEMVETMGEDGEGADGDGDGAVWEDNALCAELVRIGCSCPQFVTRFASLPNPHANARLLRRLMDSRLQ